MGLISVSRYQLFGLHTLRPCFCKRLYRKGELYPGLESGLETSRCFVSRKSLVQRVLFFVSIGSVSKAIPIKAPIATDLATVSQAKPGWKKAIPIPTIKARDAVPQTAFCPLRAKKANAPIPPARTNHQTLIACLLRLHVCGVASKPLRTLRFFSQN